MTAPPALFGVAPGADFPRVLVDGLLARYGAGPPETLARVTLYLNTRRMQRRVQALFDAGPARLLPRLRLVTDLARDSAAGLPPPVPTLRRRLELARLVTRLIDLQPDLAPRSAAFDLAGSLAALMDEMQGEGVGLDRIAALDVSDLSGHWARSQRFIDLVGGFLDPDPARPMDPEARQRRVVEDLLIRWRDAPPRDPVIVAGSTGSRGTTRLLMRAVAALPNGAVVLPGLDPSLPRAVWDGLTTGSTQEDHPQYRFAVLATEAGIHPSDIPAWHEGTAPAPAPARNALVSLALRPAPVTDGWRRDGPTLGDLRAATDGITLIEAPDPRAEAAALALCLREAAERGMRAALISPDRMLTRRVAAALTRWGIRPDDSAGEPLRQTPPGRLLRLTAGLIGQRLSAEALLALLKHPLVAAADRASHNRMVQALEVSLRRHGPPFPDAGALHRWANKVDDSAGVSTAGPATAWVAWIVRALDGLDTIQTLPLSDLTDALRATAEALAAGPDPTPDTPLALWQGEDGQKARQALDELAAEAVHGGDMAAADFLALLSVVLGGEVRDAVTPHPGVMIWGTLEARVQGADLILLAGLNDGTWPELPQADPWLNRAMRRDAGLLSPERRIGLAAHDFQQAIGAPEVILSRAARAADAPTVPSRWLNRLTNLMSGLPAQNGPDALAAMKHRGAQWLAWAAQQDRPDPACPVVRAPRPSPQPPVSDRPKELSVTRIERLIRDPYEIYARYILRLKPLDPLRKQPEARLRGTVLHEVMERALPGLMALPEADRPAALIDAARAVLDTEVPWPAARRLWLGRLRRVAEAFCAEEATRQSDAAPMALECQGKLGLPAPPFTLTAKADRIDMADDGTLRLYDYKTGTPPTGPVQLRFNRQLLLSAAIAEHGGFEGVPAAHVSTATYLGLGLTLDNREAPLEEAPVPQTLAELAELITTWNGPDRGYTAQQARVSDRQVGDYDHLSRFGEWDRSDPPAPQQVGR